MAERSPALDRVMANLPKDYHPEPKVEPMAVELSREGNVMVQEKTFTERQVAPQGYYWQIRENNERIIRHMVGVPIGVVVGVVDALIESTGFAVSEITEDVTFSVARTIRRGKEGWERGWRANE